MINTPSSLSLLDLPFEILYHIISYLTEDDIFWNLGFTCKTLFHVCLENVNVIKVRELLTSTNYVHYSTVMNGLY